MAEPIVNNVLEMLDHMIVNDAQTLGVVQKQVKWVQTELTRLQCSQDGADYKRRKGDTRAEHWLKRLREVAFHIDDATNTFYKELGVSCQKDPSFLRRLKKLGHLPMAEPVPILHKLATELASIQNVLEGISKTKGHYVPEYIGSIRTFRGPVDLDVDKTEDEGLLYNNRDKHQILVRLLLDLSIPRRAVVTIVGNTTDARMVYESVKEDLKSRFDYQIIISVTQQYDLTDLLWKMLSQLNYFGPKHQDLDYLGKELFDLLSSRRYLIVLDDVWSQSLWDELHNVLPDDNNGSRVLMTSRFSDSSRSADMGMFLAKYCTITLHESISLLLKYADPPFHNVFYPQSLLNVAKRLALECSDVPWFLIVLGKILSTKEFSLIAWERVLVTMRGKEWVEMWDQLERALPDVTLTDIMDETKVLMTVEHIATAKSVDPSITPNELHFLDEAKSRELLLKKALPYQECPSDLLELADKISKKCKGLRLALIVVGCILRTKDKTKNAWESVLKQMTLWNRDRHDDNPRWFHVDALNMNYEDMPYYLKPCFLYLASFPEDHEFPAKRLIRMWVAEGFIPNLKLETMEETAEDCLEQLSNRCMFQVLRRSCTSGLIKYFRVHDLIRDFAMQKAAEENFVTFFPKPQGVNHPHLATRRASLQLCNPQSVENVGKNTRSLLLFGLTDNLPNYSEYRLLRVLEIEGVKMSHIVELTGLEQLIHLKYLGIRNCKRLSISKCPFGRLRNLETLDLRGILMPYGASIDLWTIGTLRHVLYEPFERYNLELPTWVSLRNLQTAKWVSHIDTETHTNQFPILNNMRKLGLTNCKNWDLVSRLLAVMPSLISLGIEGENIPDPTSLPNYMNLETLCLVGKWSEGVILEASLFPSYLVKLKLVGSKLAQDPMPELGKLNRLRKLVLSGGVYTGEQLFCPAGFPVLQTLELSVDGLKELTVKNGAMPELKYLSRPSSLKLELPPDLKHCRIRLN